MAIKAADVAKLRKMTGAGMMDCKKALTETDGNFEEAIDLLRKQGQKVANKRADRDATEGAVLAKISENGKFATLSALNCETDFVAKNDDFVKFAQSILDVATDNNASSVETVKALILDGKTVEEEITTQVGVIGEKLDLSYFDTVSGEHVVAYIHPGNKLATIAAFNKSIADDQVARDIAMQIAAMNPIAVDESGVSQKVIDKEIEIGKDLAIQEGKPEEMAEKIAKGRLGKFFKENTLLNQQFVKDNKLTIKAYLQSIDKDLTVTEFKRYTLSV